MVVQRRGEEITPLVRLWYETIVVEAGITDILQILKLLERYFEDIYAADILVKFILQVYYEHSIKMTNIKEFLQIWNDRDSVAFMYLLQIGVFKGDLQGNITPGPNFPILPGKEKVQEVLLSMNSQKTQ